MNEEYMDFLFKCLFHSALARKVFVELTKTIACLGKLTAGMGGQRESGEEKREPI